MHKLIARDDIGKKVFLRSLANAPELVTDRLGPDNWETNVLCRVDGSGGKYLMSVCARPFAKGKIEYDVSCRSADPFKDVPINSDYWTHQEKRDGEWVSVGSKYHKELIPCQINCLVA